MWGGFFCGVPGWAPLFTPQNQRRSVFQRFSRSGQLCFGVASSCPLGLGWEPPGSGVMWGLQGAALGDGCGVKVAEPWRARGRDGAAWLESCGSTLLSRG